MNRYVSIFLIYTFIQMPMASASTYVDNGGTIYEAELRVSIEQLRQTLHTMKSEPNSDLCRCTPRDRSSTCDYLSDLESTEIKACQLFINDNLDKVLTALKSTSFHLTEEELVHQDQTGLSRPVFAGADHQRSQINLNQDKFVRLDSQKRLMLLAHEAGHLIEWNGQQIKDSERYHNVEGKVILDSFGATVGVIAKRNRIVSSSTNRALSKAYSRHWLSATGGQVDFGSKAQERSLAPGQLRFSSFSYRYQPGHFGLFLATENGETSKGFYEGLSGKLSVRREKIGLSYVIRPFEQSVGFFGHSHFLLQPGLSQTTYEHTLSDNWQSIESRKKQYSVFTDLRLLVPFFGGFWVEGMLGIQHENFKTDKTKINLDSISLRSSIGVSYGF